MVRNAKGSDRAVSDSRDNVGEVDSEWRSGGRLSLQLGQDGRLYTFIGKGSGRADERGLQHQGNKLGDPGP